ncbi:MAG: PQQ-dependent sugar dehydrogenase [Gammaproteobacteria bacterium]|nr:PQQ-dependent sugar dehydrogenase [Gammaproteobacteria bacterium]
MRILPLFMLLAATSHADVSRLTVPPGFEISVVTNAVPDARQMAETESGLVFVGTRRAKKIYAVDPRKTPAEVTTIASGLTLPSGIALVGNDLYVGALNVILRYPDAESRFRLGLTPEIVTESLPKNRWHGWRHLSTGPDGYLYVAVGAPCNVCKRSDPRFGSILRMDPATGDATVYARGIRNTVGMDWHPDTHELWFSDNGADNLGDDVPPDEINHVEAAASHFGFPYVHAGTILDSKFGKDASADEFVPPIVKIQAHSAALGIAFYSGEQFPESYRGALFIAEHGSWNRSSKVGYRVSVVKFIDQMPVYEPFVTGWLVGKKNWGRPADVIAARDGSLLISEDQDGVIYRVRYVGDGGR